MKCSVVKLFFLVALFASVIAKEDDELANERVSDELPLPEMEDMKLTSLRGRGRGRGGFFSGYRFRPFQAAMTCDRNPRVCGAKGISPGRSCCLKKCVNVKIDRYNCGRCGKKCKYSEICCKGKCVNPMFNRNNCGGCNNKCSRSRFCVYGMCGYA